MIKERNFHIYRKEDGKPITRTPIDAPASSIAVSSGDKFIALGFDSKVWVYSVEGRRTESHVLPLPSMVSMAGLKLDSQQVCFSADCGMVIVATRYSDGNVYTYASECMRKTSDLHFPVVKIPTVSPKLHILSQCFASAYRALSVNQGHGNDFGLSSILFDSSCVCITAFTRKKAPLLLSPQHRGPIVLDDRYNPYLGTQIQCAAQSPSELKFIFVNDKNEMFSAQKYSDANWHVMKVAKTARKQIVKREDLMAIAMTNEDTVHLFWIKGEEWVLTTTKL